MIRRKALLFDYWGVIFREGVVDQVLLDVIRQLKKTHKTAIISNIGRYSFEDHMNLDAQAVFDELFLSGETGLYKPHNETFELALEKLDVAAEDCLFIDDSEGNVAAAKAMGIESILFTDKTVLMNALKELA